MNGLQELLNAAGFVQARAFVPLDAGAFQLELEDGVCLVALPRSKTLGLLLQTPLAPLAHNDQWEIWPTQPMSATLEHVEEAGAVLGAFHAAHKGSNAHGLEVRDALWFARATPYVLAEVCNHLGDGDGNGVLSETEMAQLEEAGMVIAELSEPLDGLRSCVLYGDCRLDAWVLHGARVVLPRWEAACFGLPWLDVAQLSRQAETVGAEHLLALIHGYAPAAGYEKSMVADMLPFVRAMADVLVLDRLNGVLGAQPNTSGTLLEEAKREATKLEAAGRVRGILEVIAVG